MPRETEMYIPGRRKPLIRYILQGYPSGDFTADNTEWIGGAEIQAHQVARKLTRDCEMHVLTQRFAAVPPYESLDGVTVQRIKLAGGGTLGAILDAFRVVRSAARVSRPDVVQAFQLNGMTIAAAIHAGLSGAPLIVKVASRHNVSSLRCSRAGRLKLRYLLESATTIVSPSQVLLRDLYEAGARTSKLVLIPNGIDTDLFRPASEEERLSARKRLGLRGEDFIFSWIGRLEHRKGFDCWPAAWTRVAAVAPKARLVIAGSGHQDAMARSLVREHPRSVTWLGLTSDVKFIYAAANVNVLTSRFEGLANVLLEGMACGLPAVVSAIPENLGVGQSANFLIPFERDSVDSFEAALLAAMGSANLGSMGAEARQRAEQEYSIAVTAQQWNDLYSAVLFGRSAVSQPRAPQST